MADYPPKMEFETNVVRLVQFPYGDFKEIQGKVHEGKQLPNTYLYKARSDDQTWSLFATWLMHQTLQAAGVGPGCAFNIVLREDKNPKTNRKARHWVISDPQTGEVLSDSWFLDDAGGNGSQQATSQQPRQEQPPPPEAGPPPEGDSAPPQTGSNGTAQVTNGARARQIEKQVLAMMHKAHQMTRALQSINGEPWPDEPYFACAHSFFIELSRKGYVPPDDFVEEVMAEIRGGEPEPPEPSQAPPGAQPSSTPPSQTRGDSAGQRASALNPSGVQALKKRQKEKGVDDEDLREFLAGKLGIGSLEEVTVETFGDVISFLNEEGARRQATAARRTDGVGLPVPGGPPPPSSDDLPF